MIRFSLRWVLMIASFCLSETAWGQNRNGTNGTPNFGNTGASGLNGVGQPGFGGGGSGGGGGFGATGSGGSGGAGFGSQTGFGSGGQAGSGQNQSGSEGNNGILGRNTNQNQLLGRNVQNQNQGGNEVSGRGRAVGGRGSGRNSLANSLSNGGVSASNQRPVIRPRQEVAFDYPRPGRIENGSNLGGVRARCHIDPKRAQIPRSGDRHRGDSPRLNFLDPLPTDSGMVTHCAAHCATEDALHAPACRSPPPVLCVRQALSGSNPRTSSSSHCSNSGQSTAQVPKSAMC